MPLNEKKSRKIIVCQWRWKVTTQVEINNYELENDINIGKLEDWYPLEQADFQHLCYLSHSSFNRVLEKILNVTLWLTSFAQEACIHILTLVKRVLFSYQWQMWNKVKIFYCVPSDGYAYYEEWQHLVEKSDKEVKELLEKFGKKCKDHEVCENFLQVSSAMFM